MKRYKIVYKDQDPGCPDFSLIVRAYSEEHAIDKFYADDDDWQILSIRLID
jgi:ribosomal protein L20A (L18A)